MEIKHKNKFTSRTEEITDIIDRMPNSFARRITFLVILIVFLLLVFGYVVKYPDIVTGEVTISSNQAPLHLVAEQSGKLRLNDIRSQDSTEIGQILGWIDNPANPELVQKIKESLKGLEFPMKDASKYYKKLPRNLNLGDLTGAYSTFITSVKQLSDYQQNMIYDKHGKTLSAVLMEQRSALRTLKEKENISVDVVSLNKKLLERDSILFARRIISQSEFERSMASNLNTTDEHKSALRNTGLVREQISNTENSIQQNLVAKSEKELQLELDLVMSYNNLIDKILLWEKHYLLISPLNGHVQFLKFWNENQFVKAGEPIFAVVPTNNDIIGQVALPANGAGKVKINQEVVVKLSDYPYLEYGYVKAIVKQISLVSSPISNEEGVIDSYLISLAFPEGLLTNYDRILDFKYETKGSAEIITNNRRLFERFFDNIRSVRN